MPVQESWQGCCAQPVRAPSGTLVFHDTGSFSWTYVQEGGPSKYFSFVKYFSCCIVEYNVITFIDLGVTFQSGCLAYKILNDGCSFSRSLENFQYYTSISLSVHTLSLCFTSLPNVHNFPHLRENKKALSQRKQLVTLIKTPCSDNFFLCNEIALSFYIALLCLCRQLQQ